jgi:amidase
VRSVRWWLAVAIAVGLMLAGAPAAVARDAIAGTPSGGPVLRGIDLERATVLDLQGAMNWRRLSSKG